MWRTSILIVVILATILRIEGSKEVMSTISGNFVKAINQCKIEMDINDSVDKDVINFWNEDYEVTNPEVGCIINCLSVKLSLVNPDFTLHHDNAKEYVMKHGADANMAQQLVDKFHACEKTTTPMDESQDTCGTMLIIANCYKKEVHKLGWKPDIDEIIAEILAEG